MAKGKGGSGGKSGNSGGAAKGGSSSGSGPGPGNAGFPSRNHGMPSGGNRSNAPAKR